MEISRAIPHLLQSGVRVVGVGLEAFGVEDFVAGGYWQGELYVDHGKKAYKALELKSSSIFGAIYQIVFNRKVKEELVRTNEIPGNLSGDGLQHGATFVMDVGGAMLMDFRQDDFAAYPSPESLLQACGIPPRALKPTTYTLKSATSCGELCQQDTRTSS